MIITYNVDMAAKRRKKHKNKISGLEISIFNRNLQSQNIKAMVDRDLREGRQLGINVTPTVFINGKYLERISLGDINEMIAAELD